MSGQTGEMHHRAPGEDSGTALGLAIGQRVRQVRTSLNWTLDQLAERAGVSRRMLINIEKGDANPSMMILLRIGDALGIGLPALVEPPRSEPIRITRSGDAAILWRGEHGGSAELVAGTRAPHVVELWKWTLAPGDQRSSSPHNPNTVELLHVHQGEVTFNLDDQEYVLSAGDALEFDGDRQHSYANHSDDDAVFSLVVYEPVSASNSQRRAPTL